VTPHCTERERHAAALFQPLIADGMANHGMTMTLEQRRFSREHLVLAAGEEIVVVDDDNAGSGRHRSQRNRARVLIHAVAQK
jgi:hypothetical protein